MRRRLPLMCLAPVAGIVAFVVGQAMATPAATGFGMKGVADPQRARVNYILKCQGCHRQDADGDAVTAPPMAGLFGIFLNAPGGREYLIRVPGVATTTLPDDQLAELMNWSLYRFDPAHIPANFEPYTAAEVGKLRRAPLRTDAPAMRAALFARLANTTKN